MRGWLEYNRMMGIQKVYTYIVKSDVSSSSDIPEILKIYRELGMIDVVQLQDLNIMPPQVLQIIFLSTQVPSSICIFLSNKTKQNKTKRNNKLSFSIQIDHSLNFWLGLVDKVRGRYRASSLCP